jgi:hypothetical protein
MSYSWRWASRLLGLLVALWVPLSPLFLFVLFGQKKFILEYKNTVKKMRIHLTAIGDGPVKHYFEDVFLRKKNIPVQIQGSCVQCGNCCLNKQCVFLEPVAEGKFQCGIYSSPWRRFSNCNSYPLHAEDIARYNCPSFSVAPVRMPVSGLQAKPLNGNQLTNPF